MKKITLLFTFLTMLFSFNANAQNDTCLTAIAAADGVVNTSTIVNATGGALMATANGDTGSTDSQWYTFTAPGAGTIDVNSCGGGADTRLYVGETADCVSFTNIVSGDDDCDLGDGNVWASQVAGYAVIGGNVYYIEWDDRWGDATFDWSVTFTPAPACSEPVNTAVSPSDISANISWEDALFGSVVDYDWEVVPAGNGQGVGVVDSGSTATLSALATGLTASTPYDVYIRTDCGDPPASAYVGPINFTTNAFPPPVNDDACNATVINVGDVSAGQAYSNEFGTTETSEPGGTCWFTPGSVSESVWFTFTIAAGYDIVVSTDIPGGSLNDTQLAVYSGTCSDLSTFVEEGCDDDSGTGLLSIVTLNGLAAGTYYIQVEGFNAGVGTFDLSLTGTTLNVEQFDNPNEFSYFPNPVNDKLSLRAQSNIQNVSVYNMLGQEVLRTAPNAVSSEVSMTSLQTGSYFVQVTINDVTETIRIIKK